MLYPIATLTEIKLWLKETGTANDTILGALQEAVTNICEEIMGQYGMVRSVTEYHDGKGDNHILSNMFPIYSISELNDDPDHEWSSSTEIESTNYMFNANTGEIYLINDYSNYLSGKNSVKLTYRPGLSRFIVLSNVNNKIDFDEGAGEVTAEVTAGTYDAEDLASAIATAMNLAGLLSYTCAYDHETQKFTITASSSITPGFLWLTGTNKLDSIALVANFAQTADITGTTTTSGEVTGIPSDISAAAQMIVMALYSMSKQGGSLQMIKSKPLAVGGSSSPGTIEYYGDKFPEIALLILKKYARIGF